LENKSPQSESKITGQTQKSVNFPPQMEPSLESTQIVEETKQQSTQHLGAGDAPLPPVPTNVPTAIQGATSQSLQPPPEQLPCRFTFVAQLDSITGFYSPFTSKMHLRFQYPFFTDSAVATHQFEVETGPNGEILLNFSKRWHFSTKYGQILEQFAVSPMEFQLWTDNMLVGRAVCRLNFPQKPDIIGEDLPPGGGPKTQFESFIKSSSVPIVAASGSSSLGNLNLVLCYKNFDPTHKPQTKPPQNAAQNIQSVAPHVPQQSPRETSEYKTALELELWREQEKEKFLKKLQEERQKQITGLKEEFKRRELDRESSYRKKLIEYEKLEQQLRKGVRELETREKAICDQEKQLTSLRDTLQNDKQRFILDHKATVERMKKDAAHEIDMERKRAGGIKEELQTTRQKLKESEAEKDKMRKQVDKLHMDYAARPDVTAENELKLATAEKVGLETKLEQANKSKAYYKYQWNRTLQELARLKQEEQENERGRLVKEQSELDLLKKKLILNNEQQRIISAQRELSSLTTDLRPTSQAKVGVQMDELHGTSTQTMARGSSSASPHVARLLAEREALMSTGAYAQDDLVISQLDSQIKEAL